MTLAALVSPSRRVRLDAVRDLMPTDALRFALRRVLFTDPHAEVRAAAARRLAQFDGVEGWLVDALEDGSPLVRDALLRALARCGTTACVRHLRSLVDDDRMWWVRRGAIYALAAIAGEAELPAFTRALADPFWRVRHAAVKVLSVLGAASPALRDEVIASSSDTSTLAFLRSSWGPVAIEAPQRAAAPSALPAALLDPDPAVVTARLLEGDFPPLALVELLCDPHVPLRSLASHRIAASQDRAALEAALDWLEEPRIPHVLDTVHHLLDNLGDPAAALAALALSRPDRRGAARWAITWIVTTRFDDLYAAALARASADPALRRPAIRLADEATLLAWCDDRFLVDAIAVELHERRRAAAHDALLAIDASTHPRTRALQLDVHARRGDWPAVTRGLDDPHHGPRAVAARWLARSTSLATDLDPAVREAAITPDTAASMFLVEVDPFVRRAAIAALAHAWHDRVEPRADVLAVTHAALVDPDAWIRARACAMPLAEDRTLALVLALVGDRDEMVRSAALDAMARLSNGDARVAALPPTTMGRMWLARALDDDVLAAMHALDARDIDTRDIDTRDIDARDIDTRDIDTRDIDTRDIDTRDVDTRDIDTRDVEARDVDARDIDARDIDTRDIDARDIDAPHVATHYHAPNPRAAPQQRRPFGRAGFDVSPLAISGAYDVSPSGLAEADAAGVDLYFWEPGYDVLTRFLRQRGRRDRLRVITGSYHADAASIRLDVERALRKLRRDTLDAFLLFWTRSPARVDDAAFGVLDDLKREGKLRAIGFSTHHRELAREAIERRAWDVVMIRHSAAHPGIENAMLPTARERGTAIVTFSALCYGRMLSGPNAPTAAECYRYSLSQPGVTACISAPRRYRELVENLGVLGEPTLPVERIAALREHGRGVHAESARFNTLVRQPTRDAAAAAREMLASEPAPSEDAVASVARKLPRPSEAKRSRTRLGSIRRGR